MAKVTTFIGLVTTSHDLPSNAARDHHERPKTGKCQSQKPQTLNAQNPKLQALNRLEGFEFRELRPLPTALNTKPSETHISGFAENGSTCRCCAGRKKQGFKALGFECLQWISAEAKYY